jgi:malonate transporter and related proteins
LIIFLTALLPVILLVALGQILSIRRVIPAEGFRALEQLTYWVLFPALIVRSLATAPFDEAPWRLIIVMVAAQVIMAGIGLAARLAPGVNGPAAGSIIQSNVRWNTFVALALGALLFEDAGLALVTIAAAGMIPTANILSVFGLVANAEGVPGQKPKPFLALVKNPLIIACVIGGSIAASGVRLPLIIDETLRIAGQATLAIGLLAAGAGIDLSALRRAGVRTFGWSVVRLVGMPIVAVAIAVAFGLSGLPLAIVIICSGVPTATTGYILARQLGGDAALSANLIAMQTVLAIVTLPAVWGLAHAMGLLAGLQ